MAAEGRSSNRVVSDMDDHSKMKENAHTWIKEAFDSSEHKTEKDQAAHIKTRFTETYGPTWHVIVGEDFKAQFSHESKTFFFVNIGKTNALIWRT